jgi:hypothetical protein
MHKEAYEFVARVLEGLPPRERVVEIGGRNVNGTVRHLFGGASYVSVDTAAGPGVDVVGDGAAYSPPEPPDTVVCCEVLEHAENAAEILANAHRMLTAGGVLIVTAATAGRVPHGCGGGPVGDEFYRSVDSFDLVLWLEGFDVHILEMEPAVGDIRALAVKA